MKPCLDDTDDDVLWLSIPLDRATAGRLNHLADICHADHKTVAASLLHDVLKDDDEAHTLETAVCAGSA